MHEIVLMIEARWFAKKQILYIALQFHELHTLKPHQFYRMSPISKSRRKTLRWTYTNSVPLSNMTNNLHVCVIILNLVDIIETTAVNILIRKLIQHIERGLYTELFTKNVGTFRADTLTVFDISNG